MLFFKKISLIWIVLNFYGNCFACKLLPIEISINCIKSFHQRLISNINETKPIIISGKLLTRVNLDLLCSQKDNFNNSALYINDNANLKKGLLTFHCYQPNSFPKYTFLAKQALYKNLSFSTLSPINKIKGKKMPRESYAVWARVTMGLEWVAAAEAKLLPFTSNITTEHRDLFFTCKKFEDALQLRSIDDLFAVWADLKSISHTREGLIELKKILYSLPPSPLKVPIHARNLRITASFLGKRNYSRYEIEEVIGPVLASHLGLQFVDSRTENISEAVWCRIHLSHTYTKLGIRVNPNPLHRRIWRTENRVGVLHPPVAAAMSLLADIHAEQVIIDPFSGAGTILIEAGLYCPNLTLIGCDISQDAITKAQEHACRVDLPITLMQVDSSIASLPKADRIISNPPWGKKIKNEGQLSNNNLVKTLLQHLKPQGRAVLLADKEVGLSDILIKEGYKPLLIQSIRVSGRLADLIIIGSSPCFLDTEIGQALSYGWHHYRLEN